MTALPLTTTDGLHPGTAKADMTSPTLPEIPPMLPLKAPEVPKALKVPKALSKGCRRTVRKENLEKKPFIREVGGKYGDIIKLPLELRDALHLNTYDTIVLRKITLAIKADELIITQGEPLP